MYSFALYATHRGMERSLTDVVNNGPPNSEQFLERANLRASRAKEHVEGKMGGKHTVARPSIRRLAADPGSSFQTANISIYGAQTNPCNRVFASCQRPATTPRALIPYAAEPKNDPGTAICPGTSKTTAFPFA